MVRHDSSALLVASPNGLCHVPVRTAADPATVGDWLVVRDGLVANVLARSSLLRRADPDGGQQLLAANVDVVMIVAGLDRPVNPGRMRRAIALAFESGAVPVVVLSKTDLTDDPAAGAAALEKAHPEVEIVALSTHSGAGVKRLRKLAVGRSIVLLGESGAGKSTLTNALVGNDVAATGTVRGSDSTGRHTTTFRQLHVLDGGGVIIDTPGLRSIGLWANPEAVAATFADIETLAAGCRFGDCAHTVEPGCAVAGAVTAGVLAGSRLNTFITLTSEAQSLPPRRTNPGKRTRRPAFVPHQSDDHGDP